MEQDFKLAAFLIQLKKPS